MPKQDVARTLQGSRRHPIDEYGCTVTPHQRIKNASRTRLHMGSDVMLYGDCHRNNDSSKEGGEQSTDERLRGAEAALQAEREWAQVTLGFVRKALSANFTYAKAA